MFADTDFLLALAKDSDWLKGSATFIAEKNKGNIRASVSVMIELALLCKRYEIDVVKAFIDALEIVYLNEATRQLCLAAAMYIKKDGLSTFDAFHAAYCGNDKIISSDKAYEKIGLERIALEMKPNN